MAWNVWNIGSQQYESLNSFSQKATAEGFLVDICIPERGPGPFEVRKVRDVLESHGTQLMQLKPSMIRRCAMDDLERCKHNAAVVTAVKDRGYRQDFKQYAFHRSRVVKAGTTNDIIRAAITDIEKESFHGYQSKGRASGKRDTRLLYSDVELLKAALQ